MKAFDIAFVLAFAAGALAMPTQGENLATTGKPQGEIEKSNGNPVEDYVIPIDKRDDTPVEDYVIPIDKRDEVPVEDYVIPIDKRDEAPVEDYVIPIDK
ncbi:hypothetical protein CDEST_07977 [Colletotrichum destructivum]|uniref:Uncharacterized protein n=1 Tax=Colletotrichum destructivum TaxID=34406 RepID=A0AAX4IIW1_9PEZI|nr:hypothetical protein CDEST_07977 [Colletotrichum destructivum]